MNCYELMEQSGVSTDLNRYIGFAPDNIICDKSARTYVPDPDFVPEFLKPDASRYLAELRSLADGIMESDDTWIAELPMHDAAPTPVRGVNPMILRSVVGAIRRHEALEVKYQSLSRPEPRWRWIAPHAIGFDGFRWHTRAFCLADEAFKDFLLSRMLEIRGARERGVPAEDDRDLNTQFTLEIGPHRALSETKAKVISLDYGMPGGKAKIKVRRALLYNALRRLGLDTDPAARGPQDQQIVLRNKNQISQTAV